MIDAALIQQCSDQSVKPAIIEEFIKQAGSEDPLQVTVKAGSKTFLVPKPETPEDAMKIVDDYIGKAVIRVGVTQYPAGLGIKDKSEISADLFDACENIAMGTALFAKVYRITTAWYKAPAQEAFDDAIYAYGTGYFDGKYVFNEPDPGTDVKLATPTGESGDNEDSGGSGQMSAAEDPMAKLRERMAVEDPYKSDMNVDLSGIKQ